VGGGGRGVPCLSAVSPALRSPRGHPSLSIPYVPCPLFTEWRQSETTVLETCLLLLVDSYNHHDPQTPSVKQEAWSN
jgi:hypothetical protein